MNKPLVAVYGSLKRGFGNYGVMEMAGGKYLCTTRTKENKFVMDGWAYPYVVYSNAPQKGKVEVEIFEVENIKPLDRLEGHPSFYKRELVEFENGMRAWMYIYQGNIDPNENLKNGDTYIWQES